VDISGKESVRRQRGVLKLQEGDRKIKRSWKEKIEAGKALNSLSPDHKENNIC
jgi:hypothetical protein